MDSLRLEPKVYIEKRKKEGTRTHGTMTEGLTSGSLTSTKLDPITMNKFRSLSDDEIRKEYQ